MGPRLSFLKFCAAIAIAGATACAATPPPGGATATQAADFHSIALDAADGRSLPLSAVLGGRPALISFWAPWCEPCVKELPELEKLARSIAPCGGAVIGVAVGEKAEAAGAFARARNATFPQLADEQFHLADALGQRRIPATVVFDSQQRVVFVGESLERKAVAALQAAASPCRP
jgi:peroxiredoxin